MVNNLQNGNFSIADRICLHSEVINTDYLFSKNKN